MTLYRYAGEDIRIYPAIVIPDEGSLVAHPGDEREFDTPPDFRWVEADAPVTPAKPLTAKE